MRVAGLFCTWVRVPVCYGLSESSWFVLYLDESTCIFMTKEKIPVILVLTWFWVPVIFKWMRGPVHY